MSNKTQLQTNNTALDGYIARINAAKNTVASLPDAGNGGSGGEVETVIIDLITENAGSSSGPNLPGVEDEYLVYYVDGNQTLQTTSFPSTIRVQKNSLLFSEASVSIMGCGEIVLDIMGRNLIFITNNGILTAT